MLSIAPASLSDIPAIREITLIVWPPTYNPIVGSKQVAYMLDKFYAPQALAEQMEQGHNFVLAMEGENAIGFASWSIQEPGMAKLHKLYVLPKSHGNGVGRQILNYVQEACRKTAVRTLRLNVNIHNSPAISFYQRLGFKYVGAEDINIGSGYYMNDYIYQLDL